MRANENALWSLGVHDLSVILWLIGEDPVEAVAHGRDFLNEGVEDVVFCYLRFPSGKIAHMHLSWLDPHKMRRMTVVGREKMVVFDDMELERKVTVYEKAPVEAVGRATASGRRGPATSTSRRSDTSEPLRLECEALPAARSRATATARKVAEDGAMVVRALDRLTDVAPWPEVHSTAIVYEGTVLGEGVKVLEGAVVGKQPTLSPRSTAKREPLAPTDDRRRHRSSRPARSSSPGSTIGARVILGDQSCVRERVDDRRRRRRRPRLATSRTTRRSAR